MLELAQTTFYTLPVVVGRI